MDEISSALKCTCNKQYLSIYQRYKLAYQLTIKKSFKYGIRYLNSHTRSVCQI